MTPQRAYPLFVALLVLTAAIPVQAGELLRDRAFHQGFRIKGVTHSPADKNGIAFFQTREATNEAAWFIAQWFSEPSLADTQCTLRTTPSPEIFILSNATKCVTINTGSGAFTLALRSTPSFPRPRIAGEPWPHLLLEQSLINVHAPSRSNHLESLRILTLSMQAQLTAYTNQQAAYTPRLHAAQFQLFLTIQNLNKQSAGFGDMLWFGIPIFDHRWSTKNETYKKDNGKADATGKFIYAMATDACQKKGTFFADDSSSVCTTNGPVHIEADLLPAILHAFTLAQANQFLSTSTFSDLYVSGINIGWEMPGAFDAAMCISNLSLRAVLTTGKETP